MEKITYRELINAELSNPKNDENRKRFWMKEFKKRERREELDKYVPTYSDIDENPYELDNE